jgi:hypothetical protein
MAVFIVELNKRSSIPAPAPKQMFKSGIVQSTNFELRRCERSEVNKLVSFIQSADEGALRKMTFPGPIFEFRPDKQTLIAEIESGSGLYPDVPSPGGDIPDVEPERGPCL